MARVPGSWLPGHLLCTQQESGGEAEENLPSDSAGKDRSGHRILTWSESPWKSCPKCVKMHFFFWEIAQELC